MCIRDSKKGSRKTDKGKKENVPNDVKNQLPKQTSVVKTYLYDLTRLPVNKPVDLFGYMYQGARKLHVTSDLVKSKYYKWFSSDPSVVTVNKYGVATAKRIGTANIYFKYMTKAGKWETSVSSKVKVMDMGNVSFGYQYGHNPDWISGNEYHVAYTGPIDDTAVNYVNLTITNNSSVPIDFVDMGIYCYAWWDFIPDKATSTIINPGETRVLMCSNSNVLIRPQEITRIVFTYKINGKLTFVYYSMRDNCWKYSQNNK